MTWPPGWHPDPTRRFEFRYYNGQRWTSDVSVNGQRFVDHLESSQPPGSTQPGWSQQLQVERGPSRGFAIASFWVAFGSVLAAWLPFVFAGAIAGAVVAFVFGVIALRRERRQAARGRGYAIAGIVLAVTALGMSVIGFVLTRSVLREVNAFLDAGPHTATIDGCVTVDGLTILTGSITNDDTVVRSYTVLVNYLSAGKILDSDEASVPAVAPDATGTFRTTAFVGSDAVVECRIDTVNGPQPFALSP